MPFSEKSYSASSSNAEAALPTQLATQAMQGKPTRPAPVAPPSSPGGCTAESISGEEATLSTSPGSSTTSCASLAPSMSGSGDSCSLTEGSEHSVREGKTSKPGATNAPPTPPRTLPLTGDSHTIAMQEVGVGDDSHTGHSDGSNAVPAGPNAHPSLGGNGRGAGKALGGDQSGPRPLAVPGPGHNGQCGVVERGEGGGGRPSRRPRHVYGRLPKFSPFVGVFQHAPGAGNRARATFFDNLLLTEEEHERRKRIKTNPFTGTFHFLPGRYSSLHGLQRFRERHRQQAHAGLMTASFDELNRLAALSARAVSQSIESADKKSMSDKFLKGALALSAEQYQQSRRRSLYPHKTKNGQAWYAELTMTNGLPRQRYGGAVDISRKFGNSLDDCCVTGLRTTWRGPSLYRDILYRWNGFRVYYVHKMRRQGPGMWRRRGSMGSMLLGSNGEDEQLATHRRASKNWRRASSVALTGLWWGRGGGNGGGGQRQGTVGLSRSTTLPSNRALSSGHMAVPTASVDEGGGRKGRSPPRLQHLIPEGLGRAGGGEDYAMGHDYHHSRSPCAREGMSAPGFSGTQEHHGGTRGDRPEYRRSQTATLISAHLLHGTAGEEEGGGKQGRAGKTGHERERPRKVGDDYDVDQNQVLGEGSYAAVYGGVHRASQDQVAVKAIKRRYLFTEEEKASVRNEIENMRRIPPHRNVIRLRECFETVEHVYLVMDRSTHGNLEQMLQIRRKLTELETMWVVKQMLDAVDLLHRSGVLHCDLKPQNLLFSDFDDGIALAALSKGNQQASQLRRTWMYTSPLGMILRVRVQSSSAGLGFLD